MGCSQSAPQPHVKKMKLDRRDTGHHFGRDPNLNKADYIFSKKGKETLIKSPRDIDGQQFIIEECEGSDMFLIDHMGMLTIDYCKDCRIVTGPVASSVFIRNCEDCVIVLACQQLRLRDCKNLTIFLHSTTGPIIESSSNISIGCYNYSYFGLESNLASAEMSVWENEWYSVYDFTPANNFKLLPSGDPSTFIENVIPASTALIEDGLCSSPAEGRVTPLLYGPSNPCEKSSLFVIQPKHSQIFRTVMAPYIQTINQPDESDENDTTNTTTATSKANNKDKLVVVRTTKKKVSSAQFSTLIGGEKAFNDYLKVTDLQEVYAGIELIACEVSCAKSDDEEKGKELMVQLEEALGNATESMKGVQSALKGKYLHWQGGMADEKATMVFEQWRVKT